jgi:hypothetical protein
LSVDEEVGFWIGHIEEYIVPRNISSVWVSGIADERIGITIDSPVPIFEACIYDAPIWSDPRIHIARESTEVAMIASIETIVLFSERSSEVCISSGSSIEKYFPDFVELAIRQYTILYDVDYPILLHCVDAVSTIDLQAC